MSTAVAGSEARSANSGFTVMALDGENRIYAPKLPFVSIVPNGLYLGRCVLVKGLVTGKNRSGFEVNLCCGLQVEGLNRDNIAVHVNPRFGAEHKVVINSLIDGTWGPEERYKNPLRKGQPFVLRITALSNCFKISMNRDFSVEYEYRLSVADIKTIQIAGDVVVDALEYIGSPPSGGVGDSQPLTKQTNGSSVFYMQTLPFTLPIRFESDYRKLSCTLSFSNTPLRTVFDFMYGDDIAFHSSFRFDENAIVRNSLRNGKWGDEERTITHFPFQPSCSYEIEFLCYRALFVVRIAGTHAYNFQHRVNPERIDRLIVHGSGRLLKFRVH